MAKYSRLTSLEDKRKTRKAILVILLGIVVLITSIILGFKILTAFFLFVSNFKNDGQSFSNDDFIPPSPPQLFLPFEATNSAKMKLTGYAEPGSTVYVTINKDSLDNVVANDSGEFEINDVELKNGKNDFSAVAIDKAGNESQTSDPKTIYFSDKQPKLEVTSPADNSKYSGKDNFVEIKGNTDLENRVTINDRLVILNSNGSFVSRLGLASGENQFLIVATDKSGNKKELTIKVNYSL